MHRMDLFAGISITDRPTSIDWFDRLLGSVETFEPNDTEWVWTVNDHGHLYVEVDPGHAGSSKVTLFVDEFDAFLAAAAGRDVQPESIETYDNGVRKAIFRDPDGNEVGVGGAPVSGS